MWLVIQSKSMISNKESLDKGGFDFNHPSIGQKLDYGDVSLELDSLLFGGPVPCINMPRVLCLVKGKKKKKSL